MTILCGTDFSPLAVAASRIAAELAQRVGDSVHLVHVAEAGTRDPDRLESAAAALRALGAQVTVGEFDGIPDDVLLEQGGADGTRLIVVGAKGRRAAARWLLGSVAEQVVQGADVPVLVIRSADPFEAWLRGDRPLTVMVAADLSPGSRQALGWIGTLRRFGPLTVTVAHVAWLPGEYARRDIRGPMPLDSVPEELAEMLRRDLERMMAEVPGVGEAQVMIQQGFGRPDVHLAAMAEAVAADLVVLGSHHRKGLSRWWHGSVSRGLLVQSTTNVAVVPVAVAEDGSPVSSGG